MELMIGHDANMILMVDQGRQKARFGNTEVSFLFDGSKCFFKLCPISEEEL
jgi:hypothetical protein